MPGLSFYSRSMIGMTALFAGLLCASILFAEERPQRIVTIGHAITEIAFALDQQDRLVARDTTSNYPPEASSLPDIGYMRALSPEGVISVDPDLIIAIEGAGPPETISVLEAAQIRLVTVPEGYTRDAVAAKIAAVGAALGEADAARALAEDVDAALTAATAAAQDGSQGKRVLFILSTQGGRILAAGRDTAAAAIIALAGGTNAVASFEGYKPLTDEAIALAAPDVILMMDRGGDHASSNAELFSMPALSVTPAAETGAVIRMDGAHLLGFGPRVAEAVSQLSLALAEAGQS